MKSRVIPVISVLVLALVVGPGCRPGPVATVPHGVDPQPDEREVMVDLPPFVFAPTPHSERPRPQIAPPPALSSLPAMSLSSVCVSPKNRAAVDDLKVAQQRTPPPSPPTKTKKSSLAKNDAAPADTFAAERDKYKDSNKKLESGPKGGGAAGEGARGNDLSTGSARTTTPSSAKAPRPKPDTAAAPPESRTYGASLGDDASAAESESSSRPSGSSPAMDEGANAGGGAPAQIASDGRTSRRERNRDKARDRSQNESREPSTPPPPLEEEPVQVVEVQPPWPPVEEGWGVATYLSNDDSMSLSSAQRVLHALDQDLPLPLSHIRPHELLNYFTFDAATVQPGWDFSVQARLDQAGDPNGNHDLAISIAGRDAGVAGRRNVALTVVVDRSGSMKEEGRMEYVQRGLSSMMGQLKTGDVINLVAFDDKLCLPVHNFVVGRDDPNVLVRAISKIKPRGYTNLHAALELGYDLADSGYIDAYSNRVLVITDALANTGITDASTLSMVSDFYDRRRIRLSGVGVGRTFDDTLLNKLTEKGRGAYVFLGSGSEVDAVFGWGFTSLIETIAEDVHFRLHLPPTLRLAGFAGEQASVERSEVQAIHYFSGTQQLFYASLGAWQNELRADDEIMVEIDYEQPETGQAVVEQVAIRLGDITNERDSNGGREQTADNLGKARFLMHWIDAVTDLAAAEWRGGFGDPSRYSVAPAVLAADLAQRVCSDWQAELDALQRAAADGETQRLMMLWTHRCSVHGSARRPGRRNEAGGWPSARGR